MSPWHAALYLAVGGGVMGGGGGAEHAHPRPGSLAGSSAAGQGGGALFIKRLSDCQPSFIVTLAASFTPPPHPPSGIYEKCVCILTARRAELKTPFGIQRGGKNDQPAPVGP